MNQAHKLAINSKISIRYSQLQKRINLIISVLNRSKTHERNQKAYMAGAIHPVKTRLGNTMIIIMIVSAPFKSWYGK